MTAIANPHVTLHYRDPAGIEKTYARATDQLPPEPKEIKPHPYGVELGTLVSMLKESPCGTVQQFLTSFFLPCQPKYCARRICELAGISTRAARADFPARRPRHSIGPFSKPRSPPRRRTVSCRLGKG